MFRKLSLKLQIGLIALVAVLGLATVGTIYWSAESNLARIEARDDAAHQIRDQLFRYQIQLLQARRGEKNFIIRSRIEDARDQEQQIATATSSPA